MRGKIIFFLITITGTQAFSVPHISGYVLAAKVVSSLSGLDYVASALPEQQLQPQQQQSPWRSEHEKLINTIYIRNFGLNTFFCEQVELFVTVGDLKRCIEANTGASGVTLIFNTTVLTNQSEKLTDYGIGNQDVINMQPEGGDLTFVKLVGTSMSLAISVTYNTTFGTLKKYIASITGIPPSEQALFYFFNGCNELQDSSTFSESHVPLLVELDLFRRGYFLLVIRNSATGEIIEILAKLNYTIRFVKELLQGRNSSIPANDVSLRYGNVYLQDSKTLGDYDLVNGSTITFRLNSDIGIYVIIPSDDGCLCNGGKALLILVKPSDTFAVVKEMVSQEGYSTVGKTLVFDGVKQNDNATLAENRIVGGNALALVYG